MHVLISPRFRLGDLVFTWDLEKYHSNIAKHGITFEEAATTWLDAFSIERFDREHSYQEDRWLRIGRSLMGTLLVVWSTEKHARDGDLIRIIGARRTDRKESRLYEEQETSDDD